MRACPSLSALGFCSRYLALAGALIVTGLALGCASQRASAPATAPGASTAVGAPSDPSHWIGRWQAAGATRLTILPEAGGDYQVTLRSADGVTTQYPARAAGGRLYFQRLGKTLAIRPGRGSETGDPSMARLDDCLLVVPGGTGYCRRADSAGALPLARGAYVPVKTACGMARATDTLYFTGQALARPGQKACRAAVIDQQGMIFHLEDSCAANDIKGRSNETVTVPDEHDLSLAANDQPAALYRYCARGLLPPALRADAP